MVCYQGVISGGARNFEWGGLDRLVAQMYKRDLLNFPHSQLINMGSRQKISLKIENIRIAERKRNQGESKLYIDDMYRIYKKD